MLRRIVCLVLSLVLTVSCGAFVKASPEHYVHISELTYPAAGTQPEGFFLIFSVASDLEDVELYGHSFTSVEGGEVTTFEGGKTYCLWLHIRRMEGELPLCQVLVEGEPAEEILTTGEGWMVKQTFTVPAVPEAETPEEEFQPETEPTEPEKPTEPERPIEPELPTEPKPEIIPDPAPLPEEIPDVSQDEEDTPQTQPEQPADPSEDAEEGVPEEPTEPEEEKPADSPDEPTTAPEIPENESKPSTNEENKSEKEEEPSTDEGVELVRIAGRNRYQTAFAAADAYKQLQQAEKFTAILVASGTSFADALSGSYLAVVKQAPILLVKSGKEQQVKGYIQENLQPGGTVYLLGGEKAVSTEMESGLEAFSVKRLGGANRYETNRKILEEAGALGGDLIVCTGKHYADALCAAGTGLPVLLVKDRLTDDQKALLEVCRGRIFLAGGEAAISEDLETQLTQFGAVERLAGNTRYETSVRIARRFFAAPRCVVLASGEDFPDALTAGTIACAVGGPLILTKPGSKEAGVYIQAQKVDRGLILGGAAVLPEETVQDAFGIRQW